jgi:phosphoglycolate phosphatase-like HAD superfamily hydrolase
MWSAESGLLALDLDGTLIDARRRQLSVLMKVLAELDLPPVVPDLFWERKRGGATTAEALVALGVDDGEVGAVASRWVEQIEDEEELLADRFLPGVEDTLATLADRGAHPTVVTARAHPDRAVHQFASLGLDAWCNGPRVVEAGAEAAAQKARILRDLKAAAYVGDTESDAKAASLAGVQFAAVSTGQRSPTFLGSLGIDPYTALDVALESLTPSAPSAPLAGGGRECPP